MLGGRNNKLSKLLVISRYKDKDSYCRGNYSECEFYNHNNKLVVKYKDSQKCFNSFVGGYLRALDDNGIKYELNEEVCVD